MRSTLTIILLVACRANAPAPSAPMPPARSTMHAVHHDRAPVDVIAALAAPGGRAFIVPGDASLDLGGATIHAPTPGEGDPIAVALLDEAGEQVRIGVSETNVRYALWTPRVQLLAMIMPDRVEVTERPGPPPPVFGTDVDSAPMVSLGKPALVRHLEHKDKWTHVRYIGAFEIDGWVPDDALSYRAQGVVDLGGRGTFFRNQHMITTGAAVRAEPKWTGRLLAAAASAYVVDEVRAIDHQWIEVAYTDREVTVRGFLDTQGPPVATHRSRRATPPSQVAPNGRAPDKACLYASTGGEAIGFVDGSLPAAIDRTGHADWWTVTFDTPWGAIAFYARGDIPDALAPCPKPVVP